VQRQHSDIILWHYIENPTDTQLYIDAFPDSLRKVMEKALKMG
jgi:hypothetical protein